jgi:hypothetical protein
LCTVWRSISAVHWYQVYAVLIILYRVLHLIRSHWIVAADAQIEIGTAVISAVCRSVSTCNRQTHFLCPEILLPVGVLSVRIRITKCFTSSSGRFRREVMFENEHRSAREYTMFASAQFCAGDEQRRSNYGDLGSRVTEEVGRVLHGGEHACVVFFVP